MDPHQVHHIYTFDNEYETILNLTPDQVLNDDSDLNLPSNRSNQNLNSQNNTQPTYWRPSSKLQKLYDKFQNNILSQWPRIACVYCGKLLYPEKASWIIYDPSITYPLQQEIPHISLTFHPDTSRIPESRVPTCDSCKKPSTRYSFPYLSPIPEEIASVPLHKRKHLSPVYLHSSLGRTPNSNPFSEYRSLTGTMNYSRNIRAHALYSGILDLTMTTIITTQRKIQLTTKL